MVIVILGVLSAVALPMWFSKSDFEERGYFDEVLQAARYAQKYAVVSNCNVRLSVTASNYQLNLLASPHGHCEAHSITLPGKADTGPYAAPSGVSVTGAGNYSFLPSGAADNTYNLTIGGHSMRIHAATGFVERL